MGQCTEEQQRQATDDKRRKSPDKRMIPQGEGHRAQTPEEERGRRHGIVQWSEQADVTLLQDVVKEDGLVIPNGVIEEVMKEPESQTDRQEPVYGGPSRSGRLGGRRADVVAGTGDRTHRACS